MAGDDAHAAAPPGRSGRARRAAPPGAAGETTLTRTVRRPARAPRVGARGSIGWLLLPFDTYATDDRMAGLIVGGPGESPLETVLARLRALVAGPLGLAWHGPTVPHALQQIADRCSVRILALDRVSMPTTLLAAAALLDVAHLAVCQPGTVLLPRAIIRSLTAHHLAAANDATLPTGVTGGAGPEIYSVGLLARIRSSATAGADVSPAAWLARAAHGAGEAPPRQVAWARRLPADLPARVRIADAADWRSLARQLRGGTLPAARDRWQPLRAWTNAEWRPDAAIAVRPPRPRRRRPRVLYVSPSGSLSGPERMYSRLIAALLDRGRDVWGLVASRAIFDDLLQPAHRLRLVSGDVEFGRPTARSFDYCLRTLRALAPDIVHCNGVPTWPIVAAAEACGLPLVQHVRVADVVGREDQLARAARLIAVSEFVAGELRRAGAPPERIRVCYNGLDVDAMRPRAADRRRVRAALGVEEGDAVLLSVARWAQSKRLELVIAAFAEIARAARRAQLLIVGEVEEPVYYESLRGLVEARGLGHRVRCLQRVTDIAAVHAASDAMVLASLRDPLPNAVLESMAMMEPVVAAASGGIPEMIDDTTGQLIEPGAGASAYAAAVERILRRDPSVIERTRRARARVGRRFTIARHVDAVERVYAELC